MQSHINITRIPREAAGVNPGHVCTSTETGSAGAKTMARMWRHLAEEALDPFVWVCVDNSGDY